MDEHRTMKSLKPAVIIGTPGRMNDHLHKGNFGVEEIRTLVIDEFDKCLEFGFQEEMAEVVGQLPALKKRVLLSATDAEEIPRFTGMAEGEAGVEKLDFLTEGGVSSRLTLQQVLSPQKDKLDTLYRLLCTVAYKPTLVFVNYRESVDRVVGYLKSRSFLVRLFMAAWSSPTANGHFTNSVTAVRLYWCLPTWLPVGLTYLAWKMSCTIICRSMKRPLHTATDVLPAGRLQARRFCCSIRKNDCPNMYLRISRFLRCPKKRPNLSRHDGLPYI